MIVEKCKNIRLFLDIFWVNGNPFYHTISEHIKFRTVSAIKNRFKNTLKVEAQAVMQLYRSRGFEITRVEADQEFEPIKHELLPTLVNIADTDDHVAEVERSIRTVKNLVRCVTKGLLFKRIPKLMTRAAV
jgi:hypothetical protein